MKKKNSVGVLEFKKKVTQFEPVLESINENVTSVQENSSNKILASSRAAETIQTIHYQDYN